MVFLFMEYTHPETWVNEGQISSLMVNMQTFLCLLLLGMVTCHSKYFCSFKYILKPIKTSLGNLFVAP